MSDERVDERDYEGQGRGVEDYDSLFQLIVLYIT